MPKSSQVYSCANCQAQYPKWVGRCSECGKWGTVGTEPQTVEKSKAVDLPSVTPVALSAVAKTGPRIFTKIDEFDRVTAGLVAGSVVLLSGDPGIGKSTLVLQLADKLQQPVLYASGEEAAEQVAERLQRLGLKQNNISFINESVVETVIGTAVKTKPILLIVDSVQTLVSREQTSGPGSPSQVKTVTAKLIEAAKANKITTLLIGHVTKGGEVAGPKTLEHLVDAVLNLEGERGGVLRILRSTKNRFGSSEEVGFFQMAEQGMVEVANPSAILLSSRHSGPGSCITAIQQGSRSLLIEVQALAAWTRFGYPKRTAAGFDTNRLQLLIAVLSEKAGIKLSSSDVYVNLVGGIKSREPSLDLAVSLSMVSAYRKKPVPADTLVVGEIGLAGEIRPIKDLSRHLKQAHNLGFKQILTAPVSDLNRQDFGLQVAEISNISQVVKWLDDQL
ncbi:MAG: DNA repair protein RadA [Patescibacteria group bacterium]